MHQQVTRGVGGSSGIASVQCLSRILREYREIQKDPSSFWCAFPINMDEPFEWHFTIKGPAGTEFEGGMYHGRIILPHSYPFSPPSLMLLTGNGRFEVGKKVCLSASNYHPELWQPAWGIRTMLDALHAFFPTPGEGAIHSLDWTPEMRKKLAKESVNWRCNSCNETNLEALSRLCPGNKNIHGDHPVNKSENPIIQQINKCINESLSGRKQSGDEGVDIYEESSDADKVVTDVNDFKAESNSNVELIDLIDQDSASQSCSTSNLKQESGGQTCTRIPPNRIPPKISQQSIAWSFIFMKKPTDLLEGISVFIDFSIILLLVSMFFLFVRLIYSFII